MPSFSSLRRSSERYPTLYETANGRLEILLRRG
ncbi:hypothetical protein CLIM01_14996 [Colletotrichum limetticola]|uniref:Uncharacterized protein n=1 Tax=Colletotrichum limetticola TaxID=1209924 RepID=A0ABQ9PA09_9PEZI|nr:hypothetical protein CLIM01_14996 [Colletotrichum limetticola]